MNFQEWKVQQELKQQDLLLYGIYAEDKEGYRVDPSTIKIDPIKKHSSFQRNTKPTDNLSTK